MKPGDIVKLVDTKGLSGYRCYRRLLGIKNKPMRIRAIKNTGGILLDDFIVGYNIEGNEQGILQERFKIVKKYKLNGNKNKRVAPTKGAKT